MKRYARTACIAVALGLVGFFATVGLLNILFATQTGSFAPKNSADAASWVQAIGSIAAIVGAFWIGAWQARENQRQTDARDARQKSNRESGYKSIMEALHGAIAAAGDSYETRDNWESFADEWHSYLGPNLTAALSAFDAMPAHDLGTTHRITSAFLLRTSAQKTLGGIDLATNDSNAAIADTMADLIFAEWWTGADEAWEAINESFSSGEEAA
ncbi:MAG: hypothetical protein ACN6PV_02050 [Achromobacter sp.]|uniref:hypothetical protein n=1 Tax=Achromobacter sp. TaxID=134375 RepID=UPI003D0334F9